MRDRQRQRQRDLEEMSLLWEKSTSWRWLVRRTRESKPFFIAFATICGVVPGVIGYGVMQFTNKQNPELEARLRQTARPDSLVRTLSFLFESFQFIVLLVGLLCFFIIWYGKFLDLCFCWVVTLVLRF